MSRASGIGVYLRHVVHGLLADREPTFDVTLLGGEPVAGVRQRACRARIYSARELIEVPARTPRATDVFWSPNYNAPFLSPGRLVVTVHDVCHLALPEMFGSRVKHAYAKAMFANVRRRAARIMCDSDFTAREVTRLAGIGPERITVIYPAVRDDWAGRVPGPRPIEGPYILYVGNVKPHKNLRGLLDAFARIVDRVPHRLVIVGKREGFTTPDRAIESAAARFGSRVHFSGEIPDGELHAFYAHSDLLVLPSLYEGFGFPPLEAMAVGVPVAASRAASIPEVCGEAAAYFDPRSGDDMSGVIERALTDDAQRSRLRAAGRAQVARYAWSDTTRQVAQVLRDAAEG